MAPRRQHQSPVLCVPHPSCRQVSTQACQQAHALSPNELLETHAHAPWLRTWEQRQHTALSSME